MIKKCYLNGLNWDAVFYVWLSIDNKWLLVIIDTYHWWKKNMIILTLTRIILFMRTIAATQYTYAMSTPDQEGHGKKGSTRVYISEVDSVLEMNGKYGTDFKINEQVFETTRPARPFKHTESKSFKHTVTTFKYTNWYYAMLLHHVCGR